MRVVTALYLTILFSSSALAQVDLDQSFPTDAGVPFEQMHAAFAGEVNDPSSIQYKRMRSTDRVVCGLMNYRNEAGGYDDFGPFLYVLADSNVLIVSPDRLRGFKGSLTRLFDSVECPLSSLGIAD